MLLPQYIYRIQQASSRFPGDTDHPTSIFYSVITLNDGGNRTCRRERTPFLSSWPDWTVRRVANKNGDVAPAPAGPGMSPTQYATSQDSASDRGTHSHKDLRFQLGPQLHSYHFLWFPKSKRMFYVTQSRTTTAILSSLKTSTFISCYSRCSKWWTSRVILATFLSFLLLA